ncbi:MAG TPA: hypothetical protein PKE07_00755 [Lacibacter sp.]|nr:hypothetical protein [Lacibacter sp.]
MNWRNTAVGSSIPEAIKQREERCIHKEPAVDDRCRLFASGRFNSRFLFGGLGRPGFTEAAFRNLSFFGFFITSSHNGMFLISCEDKACV